MKMRGYSTSLLLLMATLSLNATNSSWQRLWQSIRSFQLRSASSGVSRVNVASRVSLNVQNRLQALSLSQQQSVGPIRSSGLLSQLGRIYSRTAFSLPRFDYGQSSGDRKQYRTHRYAPYIKAGALFAAGYALHELIDQEKERVVYAEGDFKDTIKNDYRYDYEGLLDETMKQYPDLQRLYLMPAAPGRGHTLKTHTLNVLKRYQKLKKFFDYDAFDMQDKTDDMGCLLRATILLHDIGKPLGDPETQHERTAPLARLMLQKWGFNEQEVDVAIALIDNDVIGEMVQPSFRMSPQKAYDKLLALAKKAGLDLQSYYRMQVLFYLCDASSYNHIRNKFMYETKDGFVYPKDKKFIQLHKMIMHSDQIKFR